MPATESAGDELLIEAALRQASHTRALVVREGARHEVAGVFRQQFGEQAAVVVADKNTFAAAGRDVLQGLQNAGVACEAPFVFGKDVHAEIEYAEQLQAALTSNVATPVVVASGTLNDLTKLAAHRLGRPYMVVATAASMDGYTAYGASITARGSKQTFDCPAPRAVVADLEVIAGAPGGMNASGYADLMAKVAAGADWIVADALGIEAIQADVWKTVQSRLKDWVAEPAAVASGQRQALRRLTSGLMMSGFAMQAARSSRPASGADHQFSHLWDMQNHTHEGVTPSHGFKVGIGTLASISLYEELLRHDFTRLDVDAAASRWPGMDQLEAQIAELHGAGALAEKAIEETRAKYVSADELRGQLERLKACWPALKARLAQQLPGWRNVQGMLAGAGCPTRPEQIGISRQRLRRSYWQALFIRRRFTVLDLAHRAGVLEDCLDQLFAAGGAWA